MKYVDHRGNLDYQLIIQFNVKNLIISWWFSTDKLDYQMEN